MLMMNRFGVFCKFHWDESGRAETLELDLPPSQPASQPASKNNYMKQKFNCNSSSDQSRPGSDYHIITFAWRSCCCAGDETDGMTDWLNDRLFKVGGWMDENTLNGGVDGWMGPGPIPGRRREGFWGKFQNVFSKFQFLKSKEWNEMEYQKIYYL